MPPKLTLHVDQRRITLDRGASSSVELIVPPLFGEIETASVSGRFVVVVTERGRVSFHAEEPPQVADAAWRSDHSLLGKMHWHSIRKTMRTLCLLPSLARRVNFQITHQRYSSGARSSQGAVAWVAVDKKVVLSSSPTIHGFSAWELGAALARYLYLDPPAALRSENVLIAAVALLDRRVSDDEFNRTALRFSGHPLWNAFHALRAEFSQDAAGWGEGPQARH